MATSQTKRNWRATVDEDEMGTTCSPWRYDVGAYGTLSWRKPRWPPIARYALCFVITIAARTHALWPPSPIQYGTTLLFPFWEHASLRHASHRSKRACQLLGQAPGSKGLA